MVEAFALRFKDLSPVVKGDIVETNKGNFLLFPEADAEFVRMTNVPSAMDTLLHGLQAKYGIPFTVINDPKQKFAGKYINQGDKKMVVINTAYADENTPLHEYYHPFVRSLLVRNRPTFDMLLKKARLDGDVRTDLEEVVVDFLTKSAKQKINLNLLDVFFDFIKKMLGIKSSLTIDNATTLSEVISLIDKGEGFREESTLTKAYQKAEDMAKDFKNMVKDRKKDVIVDYIEALKKGSKNYKTSDGTNFYQDDSDKDVAKRLSAFIGDADFGQFSLKGKNKKYTVPEFRLRELLRKAGFNLQDKPLSTITETFKLGDQTYTVAQLLAAEELKYSKFQKYGKMVHSFLQFKLERDPDAKSKARADAVKYANDYQAAGGESFTTLENHPKLSEIDKNFNAICKRAGLTINEDLEKGITAKMLDKVLPEVILVSDLLTDESGVPIGTTADGIIQHSNGEISLIDWKTGNIVSDMGTAYLMAYGDKFDLADSKLNRGYLELAFRAMILKEQHPDMVFRNIRIVKLNYDGSSQNMNLDLTPFLNTIGEYYKINKPEIYAKLQSKKLLDAASYEGVGEDLVGVYKQIPQGLEYAEQVDWLKTQLAILHANKTKEEIQRDSAVLKRSIQLTNAILELEKIPGANFNENTPDLPYIGNLKNFSDIANPKVQTLHKILLTAKDNIHKITGDRNKEHDKLMLAVEKDAKVKRKNTTLQVSASALVIYGVVAYSFLPFAGGLLLYKIGKRAFTSSTKDFYSFMWRQSTDVGRPGYYMNTGDTYIDGQGKVQKMSQAQTEYRDYIQRTMREDFNKIANKVVGQKLSGQPMYMWERQGWPSELPDDFMPRIPKPTDELREEEDFTANYLGIKTTLSNSARKYMTSFVEDTFGDPEGTIPLKYFKHTGSTVVENSMHSMHAEASYKSFMASLHYKDNMDTVKDMFIGLSNAMNEELDENRKAKYPETVKWLDDQFYPQVLGASKAVTISSKKMKFTAGALTEKITGIKEGTPMFLSQDAFLRAVKTSVTASVMSFKVFSPLKNMAMIATQNASQATRNLVNGAIGSIIGVPPDTYEGISHKAAHPLFVDFLSKKLTGKQDESKLWNLAKNFDFLPESFGDYGAQDERLMSNMIKLSTMSHAYIFYNLGETMGALWQLAGLMQGIKVKVNGKEISLWDAYNDKGEWTAGVRGVVEVAPGVFKNLEGLDVLEIKSLKRANEKLNGSYRREEKTAMEATVIGEYLFQFKKYFYQYWKTLAASPYKDITVGKHVLTGVRPDGMPIYQWHSDVMEGQFRVLYNAILAGMSLKKGSLKNYLTDTSMYDATTLKGHRIRVLGNSVNTLIWFAILLSIFHGLLDDDEEKSFVGRQMQKTIDDLTRGLSPKDLMGNLEKPVVASEKISKVGAATWDFMTEGVWGKTNSAGNRVGAKTLIRSIPGLSGARQMLDVMDSSLGEDVFESPFIPNYR